VANADLNLEAVAALMVATGVDSNAEMARRTGIERSYLSRVLRGERPAKPSHVVLIARALRVPPIAIVGPSDAAAVEAELAGLPEAS
jgi:transcriptional regulator with XRE-family HTH domain